jgi:hypothetical protein
MKQMRGKAEYVKISSWGVIADEVASFGMGVVALRGTCRPLA